MKLAFYLRLSIANGTDGESNSISNQRKVLQDYTDRNLGGREHVEYIDDGFSGATFERPGFKRMIEDCRIGLIDTILVKDLSRFGRNYIDVGEYLEQELPRLGVRFIAVTDAVDSTGMLEVESMVMNLVNAFNVYDTSQRVKASQRAMWKKGMLTTKRTPLGYVCEDRQKGWELEPKGAKIVRRVFDLALVGKKTGEIAHELNRTKTPTPMQVTGCRGNVTNEKYIRWEAASVASILKNEAYTGVLIQGKTETVIPGKGTVHMTDPDRQVRHESHHDAIVTHEEWEKARKVIRETKGYHGRKPEPWMFTGKVRCAICNRSIRREPSGTIRCNRRGCGYRGTEEALIDCVKKKVAGKRDRAVAELMRLDRVRITTAAEEKRQQELRKTLANEFEAYTLEKQTLEDYRKKSAPILAELEELDQVIAEKKKVRTDTEERKLRLGWFINKTRGELNRQMIEDVIERIEVGDSIEVVFREV